MTRIDELRADLVRLRDSLAAHVAEAGRDLEMAKAELAVAEGQLAAHDRAVAAMAEEPPVFAPEKPARRDIQGDVLAAVAARRGLLITHSEVAVAVGLQPFEARRALHALAVRGSVVRDASTGQWRLPNVVPTDVDPAP